MTKRRNETIRVRAETNKTKQNKTEKIYEIWFFKNNQRKKEKKN